STPILRSTRLPDRLRQQVSYRYYSLQTKKARCHRWLEELAERHNDNQRSGVVLTLTRFLGLQTDTLALSC
ncbi:MAG: hypothetical protein ACOYMG_22770, partial [Candidatus Methylumidiphilus sp.]